MSLEFIDIGNFFWPNPKDRIEKPKKTYFEKGDFVKAKIGPAKGNIGIVVVERNGNYYDKLDGVSEESIGVGFSEHSVIDEEFMRKIRDAKSKLIPEMTVVTRWFDSPNQLELVSSVKK